MGSGNLRLGGNAVCGIDAGLNLDDLPSTPLSTSGVIAGRFDRLGKLRPG
jgi:hypothetical protein